MNDNTVDTYQTEDGKYRIRIEPDMTYSVDDARGGDNVAEIVSMGDYYIGDRDIDSTEQEAIDRGGWPLLKRYLQIVRHAIAITMIGVYDHSGITIYPMSEPGDFRGVDTAWDHSMAGFAYVTREQFDEASGGDPKRAVDVTLGLLRFATSVGLRGPDSAPGGTMEVVWQNLYAELNDVDDVLTGNVYGYVIEQRETWRKDADPDETEDRWEEIGDDGSCWGFVGEPEYCMAEAKASLEAHIAWEAKQAEAVPA